MDGLVRRGRPWVPTEPAGSCPLLKGGLGAPGIWGLKSVSWESGVPSIAL